jgi:hypothetical protein
MKTLILVVIGLAIGLLLAPFAPFNAGTFVIAVGGGIGLLIASVLP